MSRKVEDLPKADPTARLCRAVGAPGHPTGVRAALTNRHWRFVRAPWETPGSNGRPARLALAGLALLWGATVVRAEDIYLDLQAKGEGTYMVQGRFWTPGEPKGAWVVLTDYEHLPGFVPGLESSRIEERSPDHLMLRQEAIGRALLFFH